MADDKQINARFVGINGRSLEGRGLNYETVQGGGHDLLQAPTPNGEDEVEKRRHQLRAYALWEKEGRPDGCHDAHWFQAGEDDMEQ